jgi:hypothetical protein
MANDQPTGQQEPPQEYEAPTVEDVETGEGPAVTAAGLFSVV